MNQMITYKVSMQKLTQHLLDIECMIPMPVEEGQKISIPTWVPGSYLIRDFSKNFVSLKAESNGTPVVVEKINKNTWQCAPCNGALKISYQVYCFDLAPRGAYVDHTRVFFDGCRIFLVVEGAEELSCEVQLLRPLQAETNNWRCATSMTPTRIDAEGFGKYVANNHLDLIDHPIEISDFQQFNFDVAGIPHELVVAGEAHADWDLLVKHLNIICQGHVDFFGELPHMHKYVFILNVLGKGYGGIEHRNSCSLLCGKSDLPIRDCEALSDEYKNLLGLFSHEYFHLWNVKRIKPEVFLNPDLNRENYTRQLWIFEGFTSYFDTLNLLQQEIICLEDYLQTLQKDITNLYQNPGSMVQTLEESSFDTWIKFYQPDENSHNTTISYYLKGSLVAICLDLLIIRNSRRKQSLADIMQILWQQYGKTGLGLPENYFERIAYEVTGEDYSEFFENVLRSTNELPLTEMLLEVGLVLKTKSASILDSLGVRFNNDPNKLVVRGVVNGLPMEAAGLAPNDILIAINNNAVNLNNVEHIFKQYNDLPELKLHVIRNDFLRELTVRNRQIIHNAYEIEVATALSEQQKLNRQKWLEQGDRYKY